MAQGNNLYLIFEKSISMNWIFNLQKSISKLICAKLICAGNPGSKNPVWNRLKIQFVELDFSKLIFANQVQMDKANGNNNTQTYLGKNTAD